MQHTKAILKKLHPARVPQLLTTLLKDEAISGKFIIGATVLALIAANSPLAGLYQSILHLDASAGIGNLVLHKDLRHWINDALMAIFFLVVGLEIKRECLRGELRKLKTAALPFAAAIGGMVVPALIFLSLNTGTEAAGGWAIPMATDIAFAVGVLALLGRRVPASLRLFLLTLAIVDDIGAVLVIALFYSSGISLPMLAIAAVASLIILLLGQLGRLNMSLYIAGCVLIWLAINASGVHPSIAGIVMGVIAPLAGSGPSIAERTERFLIPISTLFVIPLFAFANTGIILSAGNLEHIAALPLALGIIGGLFIGKVAGITAASWLMVRFGLAHLPNGVNWHHIGGVGLLAGIGFTVSIFITGLAFESDQLVAVAKLSIVIASVLSGLLGLLVLRRSFRAV
ncbi:Na+/H+ antiporter NhaA [Candidatus Saccharibacteria bacterium]|nr:Na+/H+ antiporter NhaA [Candidatus Saccharibacteria bacterium]